MDALTTAESNTATNATPSPCPGVLGEHRFSRALSKVKSLLDPFSPSSFASFVAVTNCFFCIKCVVLLAEERSELEL